jgi:hypothetical protein
LLRHGWRMPSAINSVVNSSFTPGVQRSSAAVPAAFEQSLARVTSQSVGAKRTRLTPDEASAAIRQAWSRVTGEAPNEQTVALLTAQWAHETAHGASMYNYNFGGIKGTGPTGLSVEQKTKEGWGRTERRITDHFRAYDSAQDGANDYVKLLTQHYPEAVTAAKQGDAGGFVKGLKQRGYFTGDEGAYERSVSSISAGLLNGNFASNRVNAEGSPIDNTTRTRAQRSAVQAWQPPHLAAQVAHNGTASHVYVAPLAPSALVAALSPGPGADVDARDGASSYSIEGVSALSMADEVIRAALLQRPDEPHATHNQRKSG